MDQVKFVEKTATNFTWSICEYFVPYDCMLLSCHVRALEEIHVLLLLECQGVLCSAPYLKLK